ncbi:hypothetical protein A6A03_10595 [Chloroflexus islandicus]|uniref:Uncharacterized protein n=1 Tax=Chloroflexus islandicus TaxID=1707952 RepID=A0A178MEW8_9CHLR|nr:hypothetical protein [Chloroflexus islandicus]OAN47066.1 hypothetical protein A6A03_10595 [Chloroflexus islandicus]
MRAILIIFVLAVLAGVPAASVTPVAQAQSGGGYDVSWSTIDSGGATLSTGGSYALGGTIGQPDGGVLSGGGYTLTGGFWGGVSSTARLFVPLVQR